MKLLKTVAHAIIIAWANQAAYAQITTDTIASAKAQKLTVKTPEASEQSDWAGLSYYALANKKVDREYLKKNRIVFMGNSITELWAQIHPAFFKHHQNYIDRGISGQTTSQMLIRFRQDVIDLKPSVVIILAGTNDIAGNGGPISNQQIFNNLLGMYELAKVHHIKVVICSVLPTAAYPWSPEIKPVPRIRNLNQILKRYADTHNLVYIDFFNAMANNQFGLPPNLSADGVHPNKAGYLIMEHVLKKAIPSLPN
jgi:lysophospholipase L1-like esterase